MNIHNIQIFLSLLLVSLSPCANALDNDITSQNVNIITKCAVVPNSQHVEIRYDFSCKKNSADITNCGSTDDNGQTKIDDFWGIHTDFIAIPCGHNAEVTISDLSYSEIEIKLSDSDTKKILESLSAINVLKPESSILDVQEIENYRGMGILPVSIYPLQYNPDTKKAKLIDRIYYTVTFKPDFSRASQGVLTPTQNSINQAKHLVINPEALSGFETVPAPQQLEGYLIISHPRYRAQAEQLALNKIYAGFRVHTRLSDNWSSESVKSAIRSVALADSMLSYICIIGNEMDVPTILTKSKAETVIYSDYEYGFMDENSGNFPDFARGRICVDNEEDAQNIIDKLTEYEYSPTDDSTFYNTAIHMGQWDQIKDDTTIVTGIKDPQSFITHLERMTSHIHQISDKQVTRMYFALPETTPLFWSDNTEIPDSVRKPSYDWNPTPESFIEQINNGAYYFLYFSHGSRTGLDQPQIRISHINSLRNLAKYPLVILDACSTGKYSGSNSNCLATAFLKQKNAGAIAVIAGMSDESIDNYGFLLSKQIESLFPGYTAPQYKPIPASWGQFNSLNRVYTNNTVSTLRIGDMHDYALNNFNGKVLSASRSFRAIIQLFGDPALKLRTKIPMNPKVSVRAEINSDNRYNVSYADENNIQLFVIDHYNGTIREIRSTGTIVETDHPGFVKISVMGDNMNHYRIPLGIDDNVYIRNSTVSNNELTGSKALMGNAFAKSFDEGVSLNGANVSTRTGSVVILPYSEISEDSDINLLIE